MTILGSRDEKKGQAVAEGLFGMLNQELALPLQTAHLTLRDFVASDLHAVYAYASDPEVTRYIFYEPRDEADTRDYIQRMLDSQVERPRLIWELAMVRRADNRLIGACDLTLENGDEADLGYILARDVWGQGYATEATREMVRAGFEQLNLERIFATCEVNNSASARVLEKAGLRRTAILANYKEAKGRWWDMYLYAITSSEW